MADRQSALVDQLLALLRGGQAHVDLAKATEGFAEAERGVVPHGMPYSAWQLLEHMRIAQRDILDFCVPPAGGYQHLAWPAAYWPDRAQPAAGEWEATLAALVDDQRAFERLLQQPEMDLYTPFAWGEGQNLLREVLLVADHNAYHLGELVLLRRVLGNWSTQ